MSWPCMTPLYQNQTETHYWGSVGVAGFSTTLLHFSIVRRAMPDRFLRLMSGCGWPVERPIHH